MTPRRALKVGPPPTARMEVQHGRNFIRAGDLVKVASDPGRRNGFLARFCYADDGPSGEYYLVQALHKDPKRLGIMIPGSYRHLRPERITRTQRKTTHGE